MSLNNIKTLAFDADDTLWVNESFYHEAEGALYKLLEKYRKSDRLSQLLFKTEMQNLPIYGYGAKSFTLSMIEAAIEASDNTIPGEMVMDIIKLGKNLSQRPIVLIEGVRAVLDSLKNESSFRIIMVTKGDLLDQRRKLNESGLSHYFDHIEIMDSKSEEEYDRLFKKLNIIPNEFIMTGNSLRSDVVPVLKLGSNAVYIPFDYTWQHEITGNVPVDNPRFYQMNSMKELLGLLVNTSK